MSWGNDHSTGFFAVAVYHTDVCRGLVVCACVIATIKITLLHTVTCNNYVKGKLQNYLQSEKRLLNYGR